MAKHLQIIRVTNPVWLRSEQAERFFGRAFKDNAQVDPESARAGMVVEIGNEKTLMLLGLIDGAPQGMSIAFISNSLLTAPVTVYHFYNVGGAKLRNGLIAKTVDWAQAHGYNRIQTANFTGRDDETWERANRRAGELVRLGTLYEIRLEVDE